MKRVQGSQSTEVMLEKMNDKYMCMVGIWPDHIFSLHDLNIQNLPEVYPMLDCSGDHAQNLRTMQTDSQRSAMVMTELC